MTGLRFLPKLLVALLAAALLLAACGADNDVAAPDTAEEDEAPAATSEADGDTPEPESAADPVRLTAQSYLGEAAALGRIAAWFYEEVESRTRGAVTFDAFWDGSLVEALGIRDAIRDGRLDVGQATHAYHPDEFPITGVTAIPFVTNNVPAQTAALTRLYHQSDAYRDEWESQGLRLISFLAVPPSVLGTVQPVSSLDDLSGMQIRGVDRFIPALEVVGANPVSLTAFEVYEALERGTVAGYTGIPLDIAGALSLHEVAPHVLDMGQGLYAGAYLAMSLRTWESLDPSVQNVIDEVAAEIPAMIGDLYAEGEGRACEAVHDADGSVAVLSEAEVQEWAELLGDTVLETWTGRVAGAGQDPDAVFATYESLLRDAEAAHDDYASGLEACAASF
jgi:TRAP-type transport system periplasmic protein